MIIDLFREIFQTLRCSKGRTALTGLSVSWGIFMLIALVGLAKGVINNFEYNVGDNNKAVLQIWGGITTQPWHGYKEGRAIGLRNSDVAAIETDNSRSVTSATAEVSLSGNISTKDNYVTTGAEGVYPTHARVKGYKMTAGRFINDTDLDQRRKVMVISEKTSDMLFPGLTAEQCIGKPVTFNKLTWTIVGVYSSRWQLDGFVPFTVAKAMQTDQNSVGVIEVEMRDVDSETKALATESDVRTTISRSRDFNPDDKGAVWINNRFTQAIQTQQGMSILNYTMWAIGILTLLTGIVGVSNIMFVSVKERTHEIGVRRAIGARPRNILTQIIMESVVITTMFGYIGICMGIAFNELLARLTEGTEFLRNPRVDLSLALQVTAVLIVAGAVSGLFPALKAIKVKPVEALRDE